MVQITKSLAFLHSPQRNKGLTALPCIYSSNIIKGLIPRPATAPTGLSSFLKHAGSCWDISRPIKLN